MRDDLLRQKCQDPLHYDRLIDWIKTYNPAAVSGGLYASPEEFASQCVNACIRGVLYGDTKSMATGMAVAARYSDDGPVYLYADVCLRSDW
jgi:hypothetical protein